MRFWQEVDGLLLRQAAKHADAIRAALIRSIDVADIVERWVQAYPAGGLVSAAEARNWARQNIPAARKPLGDAIDHIYATGWVMGQDVSTSAYAHAKLGLKKAAPSDKDLKIALNTNWDTWKPGNRAAALLVRPSGKFSQLLEQGRVSIKGMNDTTLDRVGTLLADSLESGKAYTDLARNLLKDQITSRVVTDASRAGTIAVTEMSRALNTATIDNYGQFGVEKVEWLAIDTGVCDICPANEAQGPIRLGEMFESGDTEPPAHPNCRCTVVPVVDEGPEMTDEQFAQAIMDGELPDYPIIELPTSAPLYAESDFTELPTIKHGDIDSKYAIRYYTTSEGAEAFNEYFRSGDTRRGESLEGIGSKQRFIKIAEAFQKSVANAKIEAPVIVKRGMSKEEIGIKGDWSEILDNPETLVGRTIENRGFLSTSAIYDEFGNTTATTFQDREVLLRLNLPTGTQAGANLDGVLDEAEVILSPKTQYVITHSEIGLNSEGKPQLILTGVVTKQ